MTNQGEIQASIRQLTGTTYDYNGDWHALFDLASIASGDFNGRMILWLQQATGSSITDIDGLKQLYAEQQGLYNWNSLAGRLITPMGGLLSSCVFDLDCTTKASYAGGNFLNMETTPADSEVQSEYDYEAVGASIPTFTGSQGDADSYFLFDGNDRFKGVNSLSTFLDSIHKTTGGDDFTFVMTYYHVNANAILMTNRQAGSTNIGVMMYTLASSGDLHLLQRGSTANSADFQSTTAMNTSAWNFIAAGHQHSSNTSRLWVNSTTAQETTQAFNATTATASATEFSIGAYGGGTLPIANGARIKSVIVFNELLSNTEIATVAKQLELRHNATYV
jgi:hypothetical protein